MFIGFTGDLGLSKAALVAVQSCRSGRGVGVTLIEVSDLLIGAHRWRHTFHGRFGDLVK